MNRLLACCLALSLAALTNTADAGVKRGRFTGAVLNSFGNIVTVDDRFFADGTISQLESETFTFTGTYTEQNAGKVGITTWQATLNDGSPDGTGMVFGTCFFGLVTTHYTLNTDISISAFGVLVRDGRAEE